MRKSFPSFPSLRNSRWISFLMLIFLSLFINQAVSQSGRSEKEEQKLVKKEVRQEKRLQRDRFITIGIGGLYNQTQDERMELSTFSGWGGPVRLAYESAGEKYSWKVELLGLGGIIEPEHDESQTVIARGDGIISVLKHLPVKTEGKGTFSVGLAASSLYQYRFNRRLSNSAVNRDWISSLEATAMWQKIFIVWNQDMLFQYQLRLPIVSYIKRYPGFATGFDGYNNTVNTWNNFVRFVSEVAINKRLGRNTLNRMRLAYQWDFYGLDESRVHQLRVANHTLIFSLLIKL